MKKQTKIISIALVIIVIFAGAFYLFRNSITFVKNPVPPVSTTVKPITVDNKIVIKHYTNKKYGFSFDYPEITGPILGNTFIDETPQVVTFSAGKGKPIITYINVSATTFTNPVEEVNELNKIEAAQYIGNEAFGKNLYVIEKNILIDKYPAIVVYKKSDFPTAETYDERQVFVIKDKQLFTIYTNQEDDALWSSFKFIK